MAWSLTQISQKYSGVIGWCASLHGNNQMAPKSYGVIDITTLSTDAQEAYFRIAKTFGQFQRVFPFPQSTSSSIKLKRLGTRLQK